MEVSLELTYLQPRTHSQRVQAAGQSALPGYIKQDQEDRLQLAKSRIEEGLQARGYEILSIRESNFDQYSVSRYYSVSVRLAKCPTFTLYFYAEHNDLRWPYRKPWRDKDPDPMARHVKMWELSEDCDVVGEARILAEKQNFEHVLALALYRTRGFTQYKTENYAEF